MTPVEDFDPTVYFRVVAHTLLRNYGERALHYAERALEKMRRKGDNEGFELWQGVHEELVLAWRQENLTGQTAIH